MALTLWASPPPHAITARGVLKNYNTIDEFKNADKRALFNKLSDEVRIAFHCISFRDLVEPSHDFKDAVLASS